MTTTELKAYLLEWRKNRINKLAPEIIPEFQSKQDRYDAVHQLAITVDDYPYQEYASWLAGHLVKQFYVHAKKKKKEDIIDAFLRSSNVSVKRNLLKIILSFRIDYRTAELIDKTFDYVASVDEPHAVRVYAFYFLLNQIQFFPELAQELDAIIDQKHESFKAPSLQACLKKYEKVKSKKMA